MKDNPYLVKCLELIEMKYNLGNVLSWTDKDYKNLSDQIYQVSGLIISVLTLKRLFGRIDTGMGYTPQDATKNALAIYLGYPSWSDFILSIDPNAKEKKKKKFSSKNIFIVIIILSIIITFFSAKKVFSPKINLNEINFKGENLIGIAPHTSTFYYDISKINTDSIYIDFNDNQKIYIEKNKSFIKHGYLIPFYFNVKMMHKDQFLGETFVHVLSPAWEARLSYAKFEPTIIVLPMDSTNFLYVSPAKVQSNGLDKTKGYYCIDYRYFADFSISGDQFSFECTIKNSKLTGGLFCNDVSFSLICEHNNIASDFNNKGCEGGITFKISDIQVNSQYNDLSSFNIDISEWKHVVLKVKSNESQLFLDNKQLFKTSYSKKLGKLKGINFNTMGSGMIKKIILKNEKDSVVYNYFIN